MSAPGYNCRIKGRLSRTSISSGITTMRLRSMPRRNISFAMNSEFVSCVYQQQQATTRALLAQATPYIATTAPKQTYRCNDNASTCRVARIFKELLTDTHLPGQDFVADHADRSARRVLRRRRGERGHSHSAGVRGSLECVEREWALHGAAHVVEHSFGGFFSKMMLEMIDNRCNHI